MKVSTETIIRTIVLFVTLVNSILTMTGHNPLPFAEEDLYMALSCVATIGATLWAWWKDTPVTSAANKGSAITQAIKNGSVTEKDVKAWMDDNGI